MEPYFEKLLTFLQEHWRDAIEIVILTVIVYNAYRYFKATRAARILTGLLLLIIGLIFLVAVFKLTVLEWLLKSLSVFLAIALVVIFQPELRRALAELGSNRLFAFSAQRSETIDELVEIAQLLSKKRFGALIAIERGISLRQYLETGVEMDCKLSPELMLAIFHPKAALHDGGVIFRVGDERIEGAGCVFPVSQRELVDRSIGLRHRAAMGISEESDAIAIVVSEETGNVSLASDGVLSQNLNEDEIRKRLRELILPQGEDGDEEPASSKLEG